MPSKPNRKPQRALRRLNQERSASSSFSAEVVDADSIYHGVSGIPGQFIDGKFATMDMRSVFELARQMRTTNDFVESWMNLRRVCFDDEMAFAGEGSRGDGAKLTAWLNKNGVRGWVEQLASDIWEEFLLQDNTIVFWVRSEKKLPQPWVLDCEACDYKPSYGGGSLRVKLPKLKLDDDVAAKLNQRWRDAYSKGGFIDVKRSEGERFKVLSRGKSGRGLRMPRLRQVLPLLNTRFNLTRADWAGSDQHNNVIQQIQVGRDIRFEAAIQHLKHFDITAALKKEIEKELKTKRGSFRAVTGYAVNFLWKYLDPKFFDADKYKGTQAMLDRWGGAGVMLLATGEPWLMPFFRQEGMFERRVVGGFIDDLLADREFLPIKPPMPLSVGWNPNTFEDIKMLLEKLRFATGSGIMSWETARGHLQLDTNTESERLKAEGEDRAGYEPPFEPKQGRLSDNSGGRPPEGPGGGKKTK